MVLFNQMNLFLVRAGKYEERENAALEGNFVVAGWNESPNLSNVKNRGELEKLFSSEKRISLLGGR